MLRSLSLTLSFFLLVSLVGVILHQPGSFENKAYAAGSWVHSTSMTVVNTAKAFVSGALRDTSAKPEIPGTKSVSRESVHPHTTPNSVVRSIPREASVPQATVQEPSEPSNSSTEVASVQ